MSTSKLSSTASIKNRLDKLEMAVVLLINSFRAQKVLDDGTIVVPALPNSTLDFIEKMLLTRD